ncbi:MAG: hypothetical protein JWN38_286 [Candidatus Saccharibacteria bacterium]|nr:hypothetical protein [Candidatus Saccharibacteria bacterium]
MKDRAPKCQHVAYKPWAERFTIHDYEWLLSSTVVTEMLPTAYEDAVDAIRHSFMPELDDYRGYPEVQEDLILGAAVQMWRHCTGAREAMQLYLDATRVTAEADAAPSLATQSLLV